MRTTKSNLKKEKDTRSYFRDTRKDTDEYFIDAEKAIICLYEHLNRLEDNIPFMTDDVELLRKNILILNNLRLLKSMKEKLWQMHEGINR